MSEREFNDFLYGVPDKLPRTIGGPAKQGVPTENQSLALFVKNHGGVSIDQAGTLRGEYEALFESGGRTSGAVKRHTGISPDIMAQRAADSGFIDEPDPALLKDALERDLAGDKIHSTSGDFFERKMDLEIEREFQRWAEAEEASYHDELSAKARAILDTEDIQLPTGELLESGGRLSPITRSAKEMIAEMEGDAKAGDVIMNCMLRG